MTTTATPAIERLLNGEDVTASVPMARAIWRELSSDLSALVDTESRCITVDSVELKFRPVSGRRPRVRILSTAAANPKTEGIDDCAGLDVDDSDEATVARYKELLYSEFGLAALPCHIEFDSNVQFELCAWMRGENPVAGEDASVGRNFGKWWKTEFRSWPAIEKLRWARRQFEIRDAELADEPADYAAEMYYVECSWETIVAALALPVLERALLKRELKAA